MTCLAKTLVVILMMMVLCALAADHLPIHERLYGVSLMGTWRISNNVQVFPLLDYSEPKDSQTEQSAGNPSEDDDEEPTSQSSSAVAFFNSTKGSAEVLLTKVGQNSPYVYIQLLNSKHVSDQVVEFSFGVDRGYNKTVDEWKTPKFLTGVRLYSELHHVITYDVKINFQMKVNLANEIQIALVSDSLSVDLFLRPAQFSAWYSITLFLINLVQIILLIYFGGARNTLDNTSAWLLLQSCLLLVLESIFLFRIAIAYYDTTLSWLLLPFVGNLSVMMLILWKFSPVIEKFRNKLQLLLGLLFTLAYFCLTYFFYTKGGFWVIEFNIFVWQICYSIYRGGAGGVSLELVLVVVLSRIPLLVLLKSDENILKLRPDPIACQFAISIMVLHLVVIWVQKNFGARCFTPVRFIPNYYNYIRQALYASEISSKQCSICLKELRENPKSESNAQEQQGAQSKKMEDIRYVETKCNHCFHEECLKDWLNVHLVCPNCRSGLPPMNFGAS